MAERISAVDNEARLPSSTRSLAASPRPSPSSTSTRITRSSARKAATQESKSPGESSPAAVASTADLSPKDDSPRKRKASTNTNPPTLNSGADRRSKRQKIPPPTPLPSSSQAASKSKKRGKSNDTMESSDSRNLGSRNPSENSASAESPTSKSTRGKKNQESAPRRSKRHGTNVDQDTVMTGTNNETNHSISQSPYGSSIEGDHGDEHGEHQRSTERDEDSQRLEDEDEEEEEDEVEEDHNGGGEDEEDDEDEDDEDEDDDGDPFGGFGGLSAAGLSGTLRALTGIVTGFSSRLRELLNNLRHDDPTMQLIALQELCEILLVSNEDNLTGQFSPDAFVRELVILMNKEESPEIMLLACRCLANLMEALPASVSNVVYGGAVPVLCTKLLEISFIDLAEQALSTLEKISVEYPASIVREGGLTACLTFLDFFPTSTQRTAVTTAANCCRNIPDDSFPVVRDVMPTLLNVLASNDQRVVEQASLCVSGIVESFKYQSSKLEELVSVDLLRGVLRLLLPGTTNLIGASFHTQFLRVLAHTARASPRLSAELFKLNVVETLYQILTGVSPPSETDDVASKLDSVIIMQALIHRPREQIVETLNVICELLPGLPQNADPANGDFVELHASGTSLPSRGQHHRNDTNEKRTELLEGCREEVRRFAMILFPTLTDAFSSTVNLNVRQKVLTAQLKMLSNLDKNILAEALVPVPYASFLASILSQQDHPSLVMLGLQATELLLSRLDHIYRYQFYREGVISEVTALANVEQTDVVMENYDESPQSESTPQLEHDDDDEARDLPHEDDGEGIGEEDDEDENEDEHENENERHRRDDDGSPISEGSTMSIDAPAGRSILGSQSMKSRIRSVAQRFLETHESEEQGREMRAKAQTILDNLSQLASDLESFYVKRSAGPLSPEKGSALFKKLASYFDTNVLDSVTSAELLDSGLVRTLLNIFSNPDEESTRAAQSTFLEVFMGHTVQSKLKTATTDSPVTPYSVMAHKLQDLLSRSEHFEVITVHQNSFDGNKSSPASMLGKQIRLRLVSDEESDIPKAYRNIMVSIHAIAHFKTLDEYLRTRISLASRPRDQKRDNLTRALAAMAGAGGHMAAARSLFGALPQLPTPSASNLPPGSKPATKKTTSSEIDTGNPFAGPSSGKSGLRRSSRNQPVAEGGPPMPPPDEDGNPHNTLECADEKQISDGEDEENADNSALDAILGEVDEEMSQQSPADASAVNMEVAGGGKVTARKEDGTRIRTPRGSGTAGRLTSSPGTPKPSTPTPSISNPSSYAAALSKAEDWHIEFMLGDKIVPNETTIYRAVHTLTSKSEDQAHRSIWSTTHSVKFRRASGPAPAESPVSWTNADGDGDLENGIPLSLAKNPTTASILQLLNILHELNANIEDVLIDKRHSIAHINREPLSQFVNTKLTAKLNRQLEEPLIVASNCLPSWAEDLARLYPFLFPFETRHLFLQSTSFGYARSMARWQSTQSAEETRRERNDRPFLGRLQRQKVRISRTKILESALKVMDLYGASQSILEVEYFEEVGTGLGPTLEFYSTVSQEFSKKKLRLWRDSEPGASSEFVSGPSGLFPRPMSDSESGTANGERTLHLFKMLGKFVARSMIDSRIIDIHFNPIFFRIGEATSSGVKPSLGAVKMVDSGLAQSLMMVKAFALAKKDIDEDANRSPAQKVIDLEKMTIDGVRLEDLCLDFTLPGYPEIELKENGSQIHVTMDNVESYLEKVIDATLGSGVRRQVKAFRAGFSSVFPYSALSAFTPDELVNLFGRADEDWSLETLLDSMKADHGYNMDSPSVRNLLQLMSQFDTTQRREFLQFTTGSPKLPIGGFKSLTPMFTVVCKPSEEPYTSDDYLPSVMTCVNYLKLPNYSSIEAMQKQLTTAMREGQGAFLLS